MIKYECIKEITKALRKNFKGIQSNSYGYCCTSDYDAYHDYTNNDDYVCAKIYKGGLNNDYNYNTNEFELGDTVFFMWTLTNFALDDVIKVMTEICDRYNYKVVSPTEPTKCIEVIEVMENI